MKNFTSMTFGITSRCNATCKFCSRHQNIRFDNKILDIDLNKIISPLLSRTSLLVLNGTLGDPILHPNFLEFIRSTRSNFKNLKIIINTNGGVMPDIFWKELGMLTEENIKIVFGIDGLEDTHKIYRGTNFKVVLNNMKNYIEYGGYAIWQFIIFKHNYHQIEEAVSMARKEGCKEFLAFRADYYDSELEAPDSFLSRNQIMSNLKSGKIDCYWKKGNMIYVNEYGEVHPCCHLLSYYSGPLYDDIREKYLEHKDSLNLYNHNIDEVLKSPYLDYIYNNPNSIKRCRNTCSFNSKLMPYIKRVMHYEFK